MDLINYSFTFRLVVLSVVLFGLPYGSDQSCSVTLVDHGRGYMGILVSCLICESAIIWLSMRGSILYTQPREAVQYVLYIRLGTTHRHVCLTVKIIDLVLSSCSTLCDVFESSPKECSQTLMSIILTKYFSKCCLTVSISHVFLCFYSYSVGRACICCSRHCLACPVLPAMF